MRLFGQVGDHVLEIARDVADGDVLLRELPLELFELGGEALGQRPDGVVLRRLDQLPLVRDHLVDGLEQLALALRTERKPPPDPGAQFCRGARGATRVGGLVGDGC